LTNTNLLKQLILTSAQTSADKIDSTVIKLNTAAQEFVETLLMKTETFSSGQITKIIDIVYDKGIENIESTLVELVKKPEITSILPYDLSASTVGKLIVASTVALGGWMGIVVSKFENIIFKFADHGYLAQETIITNNINTVHDTIVKSEELHSADNKNKKYISEKVPPYENHEDVNAQPPLESTHTKDHSALHIEN
jgi:DUF1009 family protein